MFSQGMLGTQDLGQVYFEPIKDKHGNALLVLLKDMNASPNLDGVRWMQLCKLQLQRKSISSPEEPTALDMLLITLHVRKKMASRWTFASVLEKFGYKTVFVSSGCGFLSATFLGFLVTQNENGLHIAFLSSTAKYWKTFIYWNLCNAFKLRPVRPKQWDFKVECASN